MMLLLLLLLGVRRRCSLISTIARILIKPVIVFLVMIFVTILVLIVQVRIVTSSIFIVASIVWATKVDIVVSPWLR